MVSNGKTEIVFFYFRRNVYLMDVFPPACIRTRKDLVNSTGSKKKNKIVKYFYFGLFYLVLKLVQTCMFSKKYLLVELIRVLILVSDIINKADINESNDSKINKNTLFEIFENDLKHFVQ